MKLPDLRSADLAGKKVLLRLDLDVPFVRGVHDNPKFNVSVLADPSRLEASLPTIKYLLDQKCKIVACGHLGRPRKQFPISPASPKLRGASNFPRFAQASRDEQFPKENEEFSLQLIAKWFAYKLNSQEEETNIGEFRGWKIKENFYLLENLRFHKGEEENSEEFAKKLAGLADTYVNDAFASSHRSHASVVGVCRLLPHFAGLHLQEEIKVLSQVLGNPRRPLTVVIGGEKIETKLPLVEKMFGFADSLLVGGEIAGQKEALSLTGGKTDLFVADLTDNGEDITDDSLNKFVEIINKSATVVWNGPLGVVRTGFLETPTIKFARTLSENPNVYSVVGGGDTVEVIVRLKLKDKFSFVSTVMNLVMLPDIRNITVSGRIASGSTTLAQGLSDKLSWKHIEGGDIFWERVREQMGLHSKDTHMRPDEEDKIFDEELKRMLKEEKNLIVETKLAGFNAQGIDGVFKILLVCEDEKGEDHTDIRIDRLINREQSSVEEAKAEVLEREQNDLEKFRRMYAGSDPNWVYWDRKYYDLTVNTFSHNKEESLAYVLENIGYKPQSSQI